MDVLNGTFIGEIADLLESATAPDDKGKAIFEIDHVIEELAENIQKNFTDIPIFMKSLRASARQVMIRRLAKYSKDKAVWIQGEDFIQELLQKNIALTVENTQLTIDRAQTFLSREDRVNKIQTSKDLVVSTTSPPDIMQQLAVLQEKVVDFEAGQSIFSVCGGGRGDGMCVGHGRGRGTPQVTAGGPLKKCTKGNHDDSACFKVGDELTVKAAEMEKQSEEIEQHASAILSKRKNRPNNKSTSSEIKTYSPGLNANKDIEECVPLVFSSASSSTADVASVHTCDTREDLHVSSPTLIHHGHLSYTQMKSRKYDEIFAPNVVLDQCLVPGQNKPTVVTGTIIDSATMMDVIQGPQGSGQRVQLLGITGDQVSTEIVDVVFPILTQVKKPYALATKGTTLVLEMSKDNILSLTALLKAGVKVTFAVGTP